ncbi:class I adenylate-forming enzyme family protein [Pseudonocardia thermophila]|jgi:Acyl-CoA synthetases (AMP-forming)/AMP-acid ligases II|uniref:class I adenylate-forming enzyme family protein n=1 Tax=Pseudonocardia thermophila TaxID=1848 RepID=UPI00248D5C07|nr:AMP-binding protein [Pseudonocardia thermophila]
MSPTVPSVRPRSRQDLCWTAEVVAREYPGRVAVIDAEQGVRRTYAEFDARARRVANALERLGIGPGDRFGLLMQNCVEYLEVVYGAAKIGATVVLINRRLSPREMAYELTDSQSAGLVYSTRYADTATEVLSHLDRPLWSCQAAQGARRITADHDFEDLLAAAGDHRTRGDVDLADAGWVIIYTSGTTGRPKGVVLSQANIVAADDITARFVWGRYRDRLGPVVRGLVTAGLNHIGGLITSSTPVLADGGTLVLLDDFDPVKMLRTIERYRVNFAFSIGMMWNAVVEQDLAAYDLSSLQVVGTCIAQHTDEQLRQLSEGLGAEVFFMFGQTETSTGLVTTRHTTDLILRRGTLGKPHGYVDVRIVDAAGAEVAPGEVGELQYRGPSVFKEYFGRPGDTEAAFADGWFRSGDLVRADEDGYLYFVDRLKDMIKSGGLNVFTVEVERVLLDHPAIADAAVVGIPDPRWGEAVTAFVVPEAEAVVAEDDVIAFCRDRIAHYKCPKAVHIVDRMPVNPLGKKLKHELRAMVLQERAAALS